MQSNNIARINATKGMPEAPESAKASARDGTRGGHDARCFLNTAEVPESAQASVPESGAELIDNDDACAILVDKRPSGALFVL